jgi:hypothetical protein
MNQASSPWKVSDLQDPLWWRRQSADLFFMATAMLSTAWPDKFHDFGPFQQEMCWFLEPARHPAKKKLLAAYRESLKTTVLLGFAEWLFSWYHVKREPTTIVYNTATEPNALDFMENFRFTLMNCPLQQAAFGLPADERGYDQFTKKVVRLGHVQFKVSSQEEQQASRHAKIIINDDLVNELNYVTEHSRDDVKRKWRFQKSVASQISKTDLALEIDSGTPYHYDDLMWWLMKKNTTYDKFISACVSGWPDISVSDVINRTKPLRDTKLMTYEKLMEKLEEQGNSIFSSQYCMKPLSEVDALCKESWLKYWTLLPAVRWRTMVIDAGGSDPAVHDATGITIVDCDPYGNLYVVYAQEYWPTPQELIRDIKFLMDTYRPDDSRIEKEKYAVTIADTFEHVFPKYNISFVKHEGRTKAGVGGRIMRLRQWFENGRILIGKNQKVLEDKLLQYPQVRNDDILDSLAYHLDVFRVPKETEKPTRDVNIEPTFVQEFDEYMGRLAKQGEAAGEGYHDAIF